MRVFIPLQRIGVLAMAGWVATLVCCTTEIGTYVPPVHVAPILAVIEEDAPVASASEPISMQDVKIDLNTAYTSAQMLEDDAALQKVQTMMRLADQANGYPQFLKWVQDAQLEADGNTLKR